MSSELDRGSVRRLYGTSKGRKQSFWEYRIGDRPFFFFKQGFLVLIMVELSFTTTINGRVHAGGRLETINCGFQPTCRFS